ncbi:hypothetical protein FGG08_003125 [Glutinoglossum americanum]|uniref:Uncharacterized protein n=1 Tax=Glutinoglossum americanum TaxID=1670608 RepID=A0A9P8I369_9PEZI|nr:hypothetical protein FGG08_003125 [Glutinoglossum americanum]
MHKPRLYVALYARGNSQPDGEVYHWALIVGPKEELQGSLGGRYHVKNAIDGTGNPYWYYQRVEIPVQPTSTLLVRITVAKVADQEKLEQTLENVPLIQNEPNWNCRVWIRDALAALEADERSLGTKKTDWQIVEHIANWYVQHKKDQHRFDGQVQWDMAKAPTYNLLEDRETIP